jgi:sulfur relay protein TusB/DsrH
VKKNNFIIYLYGFNTLRKFQLDNLLKIIKEQINIGANIKLVLIHDGVIGLSKKGKKNTSLLDLLNLPLTIYAIKADLLARGIDIKNLYEKIKIIDYEDLVDLLAETPRIVSWV